MQRGDGTTFAQTYLLETNKCLSRVARVSETATATTSEETRRRRSKGRDEGSAACCMHMKWTSDQHICHLVRFVLLSIRHCFVSCVTFEYYFISFQHSLVHTASTGFVDRQPIWSAPADKIAVSFSFHFLLLLRQWIYVLAIFSCLTNCARPLARLSTSKQLTNVYTTQCNGSAHVSTNADDDGRHTHSFVRVTQYQNNLNFAFSNRNRYDLYYFRWHTELRRTKRSAFLCADGENE